MLLAASVPRRFHPFFFPFAHAAAELGESDHRHVQFAGHLLEAVGDARELLHRHR